LAAQAEARFDRESDQLIELVQHRMQNYADALWGGVAMIQASDGDIDFDHWKTYANSIHIEKKYPGINGMGVIHALPEGEVAGYLTDQQKSRPDFHIHPAHDGEERYPIAYIVPVKGNEKAVGLDMAHESNRYTAAKQSRDSGQAQITGPITLVQDNDRTPGFLFYTPFYKGGTYESTERRREQFSGLVYAPFVVNKLMEGVLEKDKRHVGIRLSDGADVLHDELNASESDFDPDPLFKRSAEVSLYGRTWRFDVWTTNSFRHASLSSQPLLILLGGILIDALLVFLFMSISRSSRKALGYADSMTHQLEASKMLLEKRATQLEASNAELEQFAFIASHDLQEPLRKVASFCGLIAEEYGDQLKGDGMRYIDFAIDGATRMRSLVQDLLLFSRFGSEEIARTEVNVEAALKLAILNLDVSIEESQAEISNAPLPILVAHEQEIVQLLQNLIGNAIKYRSDQQPKIHVAVESQLDLWQFSIVDNGIGIAAEYQEQVFGIFKRLHSRKNLSGTGIGLAICKRIVEGMGGNIWFETKVGPGCKVCFTAQKQETSLSTFSPTIRSPGASYEYV
jgi:signal transduction histidine kinase